MKTKIPAWTLLVFLLLPLSGVLMAQSDEQIASFKKEREEYFTKKLALTDAEAKAFLPLYDDYFNRKDRLFDEERNTFDYCFQNQDNLSEKEFIEALAKIRKLKDSRHQLEQEYFHEKFPTVLSNKKVILLYRVEWDFRRHLLRKIRNEESAERKKKDQGKDRLPVPTPLCIGH